MIFGNQNNDHDESVQQMAAPPMADDEAPAQTNDNQSLQTDDDSTDSVLDQPTPDEVDESTARPSSNSYSSIIAPADRDIPAIVHSQGEADRISQAGMGFLSDTPPASSSPIPDELIDLKQQALGDLEPLIGQLDQTPEERFRTTMMMIQSTDNSALIKDAYAAAQAIDDDKMRAQALLDIVNEINYFTQQSSNQSN